MVTKLKIMKVQNPKQEIPYVFFILKTISFVRYERFEKNQVQVKHGSSQGAIKKTPVPGGTPVTSSASKSLMDAPLIDFSSSSSTAAAAASEAPQSFTQVPSMAHFPVS